jgi:drug/metabolite transporter (DMT)-like permease
LGLVAGTLILKRFAADIPAFESTAVQLVSGAICVLLLMLAFETPHWRWTWNFAAALAWNTLAMSIFGMAVYSLMLERYGAGRASSGFFIVPGASAIMALLLLGEHLTPLAIAGLAASTLGVALVWWKPKPN